MLKDGIFYIVANGIKHWVKIAGSKHQTTPLVMVHGGPGGHHYVFENTIGKRFETDTTVIYYEQRGSGRSDAPIDPSDYRLETLLLDLKCLLDVLELSKVDLLGYSFGGELIIRFAYKYPSYVHRLIAESPSVMMDMHRNACIQYHGFLSVANEEEKVALKSFDCKIMSGADLMNELWNVTGHETHQKFLFHDATKAPRMYELWGEAKLMNTGLMMDVISHETGYIPIEEFCPKIMQPTLIVIGDHDRNCGVPLAMTYHDLIQNSTLKIIQNAAHFSDFEQEDTFYEVVHQFLYT